MLKYAQTTHTDKANNMKGIKLMKKEVREGLEFHTLPCSICEVSHNKPLNKYKEEKKLHACLKKGRKQFIQLT